VVHDQRASALRGEDADGRRLVRAELYRDDPVGQWRNEMRQLFRGSPLSDPELAAELHARGVDMPPYSLLDVPDDPYAVQAMIEILGWRWVEDNYRSLYEAARDEQVPERRLPCSGGSPGSPASMQSTSL
jgi:hypothetical protein